MSQPDEHLQRRPHTTRLSRESIREQDARRGEGGMWLFICLLLAVAYLVWRW